jgi:hypothetical protein
MVRRVNWLAVLTSVHVRHGPLRMEESVLLTIASMMNPSQSSAILTRLASGHAAILTRVSNSEPTMATVLHTQRLLRLPNCRVSFVETVQLHVRLHAARKRRHVVSSAWMVAPVLSIVCSKHLPTLTLLNVMERKIAKPSAVIHSLVPTGNMHPTLVQQIVASSTQPRQIPHCVLVTLVSLHAVQNAVVVKSGAMLVVNASQTTCIYLRNDRRSVMATHNVKRLAVASICAVNGSRKIRVLLALRLYLTVTRGHAAQSQDLHVLTHAACALAPVSIGRAPVASVLSHNDSNPTATMLFVRVMNSASLVAVKNSLHVLHSLTVTCLIHVPMTHFAMRQLMTSFVKHRPSVNTHAARCALHLHTHVQTFSRKIMANAQNDMNVIRASILQNVTRQKLVNSNAVPRYLELAISSKRIMASVRQALCLIPSLNSSPLNATKILSVLPNAVVHSYAKIGVHCKVALVIMAMLKTTSL